MTLDKPSAWRLIHAERARVADMLDGLSERQWRSQSLCSDWSVEQVVAHLTAAASTGTWGWLRSIVLAGFSTDRHNARRLAEQLGGNPEETAAKFREAIGRTAAPTSDHAAWLGEVIVHGQDIARPLGIALHPDPVAVLEVAEFFAAKDFAVNSRTLIRGLRLESTDAEFAVGDEELIRGPLLSLVMAMAGRSVVLDELEGDGVELLRARMS